MNSEKLLAMVTKRKSVRSLSGTPLEKKVLDEVLAFSQTVKPLFPAIKTTLQILPRSGIKSLGSVYAPQYIALYSERTPEADMNAGFILQQIDLFLSSKELGSCWLGMTRPVREEYEGLPFVILMAFGHSSEPVHRTSESQFRRKPLNEIAGQGVMPRYMNAIRLAPSAINRQPWYFSGDEHSCHAFSVRGKGLINLAEGWRYVDLGISLAHLYLAATNDGKTVRFNREDSIPSRPCCEYMLTCKIS